MKNPPIRFVLFVLVVFSLILNSCAGTTTPTPTSTAQTTQFSFAITPEAHPQIIGQKPAAGERLGPLPVFEYVFDRPMQTSETGAAWSLLDANGKPLNGVITWKDERTFQFKPDQALTAGQAYTGIFSTAATGADGSKLLEEIQFSYQTTSGLMVGQVFPADQTTDVDANTAITVIFNKPVIPIMTLEDQAKLPSPITIQPAISGSGSWVNSSVYVFQPENSLKSGAEYKVSVQSGLKDTTGTALEQPFTWSFSTQSPYVSDFGLQYIGQGYFDTVTDITLEQAFMVTFNQAMDAESVSGALSINNVETGKEVPVKLEWDETGTVVTVTPVQRLSIASFYTLTVHEGAQSQDGGALLQPYQIKLNTLPLPAITNTEPAEFTQSNYSPVASVYFNTPMRAESIKNRVKILPESKEPLSVVYQEGANRLDIIGLKPSTQYVIRVLPGMTDVYGNAINSEYKFTFETASIPAQARLLTAGYPLIFRQKSDQSIFFEYSNIQSADISLYKLSFDELAPLMNGTLDINNLPKENGTLIKEWTPELKAEKDQYARISMHLDEEKSLEPGYYYLGLNARPLEPLGRFWQGIIIVVSNNNLTLKATQGEALAWLLNADTGQPVPGETLLFYNDKIEQAGSAVTDKNGIVHLTEATNVQYVRAESDKNSAMTALWWGSGVNVGEYGIWTDYWSEIKNTFVYTYTERPLYRPNQQVYIKGIVRANDDLHYSLPTQKKMYLSIDNDQGKLYGDYVTLSKNGTFASEYALSPSAPVGNYTVTVRETEESENILSWMDFRVAEYVKPEFEVTASAVPGQVLSGEDVTFSLDAAYYSGGALSNANVSWFLESQPYFYNAPPPYDGYSFNDFDYYDYYYGGGGASQGEPLYQQGEGTTDEKGHFELVNTMELPESVPGQQVNFSANITDVGGNLVGSNTSTIVLASAVHAGIRPENYVGKVGEPQTINLVVLDLDGKPLAGQEVNVEFEEQQWFSVERKDEYGISQWETSVKSIPVGSEKATTAEDGTAMVSFTPEKGGEYKVTVTASDSLNRPSSGSSYLWISSNDYIAWRQTNDRSFQLVADKNTYEPGDTAKILIAQPFEGENYALITTERGHIYEEKVIKLQGNSTLYELPITSDMAPVMYFSVMVVKPADGKTPPDFKTGIVRLNINPSRQNIFVSLESDKSAAQPGDTVTYTVTTRDLDGKPIPADVSLALVDKAVLALAPTNSVPLLSAFYPERGLSVNTASSIVLNAEDFNVNYQETAPTGESAGGGGKGDGAYGIVTVRQNFKDTAFWKAQVVTDKNGTANVQVTLPDNLTTWQMKARAVTDDTRVGEAESELLSTRPLQIQLQTPRFFVVEDNVTIGAVIHNNTGQELKINVSLQAEGLQISSTNEQNITLASGNQAYVTWEGKVDRTAKRVDLLASAKSGQYSDATRPTLGTLPGQGLPVLAFHVSETVGSAGILREAGSVTEAFALPTSLDYLSASLNLNVSPSLAASMTDGLGYLTDYPYMCMEQTVSRFLPNLISLQALKLAGKSTSELQNSLDEQVQPALQRIISTQNGDGGWSLWPGAESQPNTTAYVVIGLEEAKKAGYTFPEYVEEQAVTYLQNALPTTFEGSPAWLNNQSAMMLYALALAEKPEGGKASALYESRTNIDIFGKALLMQAMQMDDNTDKRIQTLLSEINSAAAKSATGTWWDEEEVDYYNWNTDVRTTAIVLNALIQVDPKNALIPDGIRWLMKHREGSHWYSTQETAWALMALTNWLTLSGEFNTNYQYAVGLNGELQQSVQADSAHLSETTSLQIGVEKMLTNQANTIVITRGEGEGVLYYTAGMEYSLPVKDIPALDQGMMVSEQFFRPDDLKTPLTEITRGELVQVRLTLIAPESLHYVVVDSPLPAGLEAVDASLQTSQQVPTKYQRQDFDKFGWGWWYFYYKQIYDDRVVMSADYLPAGTYTITYMARASTTGQFHVLPATAREFYFPDVAGRSAGAEFTVKP